MIKQTVILLIIIMLAMVVNIAYAGAYLPLASLPPAPSVGIPGGYMQRGIIDDGYYMVVQCANGQQPSMTGVDGAVVIFCEGK